MSTTQMARLAPGHFSIHPDDLDGREMVTTVRTATDGELNVEFKATIHMEMSAFQRLAEKKFKGVYWLSEEPVNVESGHPDMPFAVYVLNDSVNTMGHVSKTLEKVCSLPAHEAQAAMLMIHNQGKEIVFKSRTEAEALEVQTQLQQAGLTSEVKTVEG